MTIGNLLLIAKVTMSTFHAAEKWPILRNLMFELFKLHAFANQANSI